jgi:hypothetical protein
MTTQITNAQIAALIATFDDGVVADLRDAGYRDRDIALAVLADDNDDIRAFREAAAAAGDLGGEMTAADALREPFTAGSPADCARRKVAEWMLEASAESAYARAMALENGQG